MADSTNYNMGTVNMQNTNPLPTTPVPDTPVVSNNLNVGDLTGGGQLKGNLQTPPAPVPSTADVSTYASLVQGQNDKAQTAYNDFNNNTYVPLIQQYKQAQDATEGKNAYTQDLTNSQGLQGKTQAVQDIINQITAQDASNKQAQVGYGTNVGGVTASSQQAFNAEAERANTVKQLGLGASLAAAQGNLAIAQNFVDKAVSAKYDDAEKKLANLKDYLAVNKDQLEKLDKRAYDAQTTLLNAKQKDLETEKKNFSDIQNMIVNASSQNAPTALVQKAKQAKTPGEAAMILGQYAGDYYKTELLKQQIATERAQRAKIYDSMTGSGNGGGFSGVAGIQPEKFKDATARTLFQTAGGIVAAIGDIKNQAVNGNYNGLGYFQGNAPSVMTSDAGIKNRAFLNAINLKTQQWASGASLTKEQIAMVNKMVPSENDADGVITSKLNALSDYMTNEQKSIAEAQGQKVLEPQPPNPFEQAINPTAGNTIPGTSIIKNVSGDGNIIFDIPTSTTK